MEQQIARRSCASGWSVPVGSVRRVALAMSCIGLYGVVSFDVSRRLRDIGVRMALGAQRVSVIWQVLRTGLAVSLAGIVAGLAATVAATRMLSALLFDITSRDPLTLAAAAALLVLTAVTASFLPAHRASRVDPVVVLRAERAADYFRSRNSSNQLWTTWMASGFSSTTLSVTRKCLPSGLTSYCGLKAPEVSVREERGRCS